MRLLVVENNLSSRGLLKKTGPGEGRTVSSTSRLVGIHRDSFFGVGAACFGSGRQGTKARGRWGGEHAHPVLQFPALV